MDGANFDGGATSECDFVQSAVGVEADPFAVGGDKSASGTRPQVLERDRGVRIEGANVDAVFPFFLSSEDDIRAVRRNRDVGMVRLEREGHVGRVLEDEPGGTS